MRRRGNTRVTRQFHIRSILVLAPFVVRSRIAAPGRVMFVANAVELAAALPC
jgi:hypothetical protein